MAFTTDLQTDIGKVRLLLFDLDVSQPIFPDDAQVQAFIDLEGGSLKLGAALALETIAANRVLTLQVGQILDLKMDGYQVAKGLRETAKAFRDYQDDWSGIEIAEIVSDSEFAWQEKYWKLITAEAAG